MNYVLVIEYLGTAYCGWQRQKNGLSIQEVIENALKILLKQESITLVASGRTDAGVHAFAQVANFKTDYMPIPLSKLPIALNAILPKDVCIHKAIIAPDNFNARFSAKKKTYVYKLFNASTPSAIRCNTHYYVPQTLDMSAIASAAKLIEGEHDFRCFRASGDKVKNTVRTIYSLDITKANNEITISVTGNGFLYNMVRIIAGTLLYVGLKKLSPKDVENLIQSGDRKLAGKTLPPHALYLKSVEYEELGILDI